MAQVLCQVTQENYSPKFQNGECLHFCRIFKRQLAIIYKKKKKKEKEKSNKQAVLCQVVIGK